MYTEIDSLKKRLDVTEQWDTKSQSPYLRYSDDGTEYELWFENARSVTSKIKLVKENGLGGITFWHIGGEDPGIWEVIKSFKF